MLPTAGPYPTLKFPTLVSRITQTTIQAGLLFFRTSPQARAAPRFLRETAMLPPLAYSVCVDTLLHLASTLSPTSTPPPPAPNRNGARTEQQAGQGQGPLQVYFADEEGDPYAVALAGRLGAFVAGRDSDFVVLNAEGYAGYVPLDEMLWTLTSTATTAAPWDAEGSVYSASIAETEDLDEDGFQIVKKGKGRKRRAAATETNTAVKAGRGILPPHALPDFTATDTDGELALTFAVYEPGTIAAHLGIPVSLLPLLGAFLGNDFTGAPNASDDTAPPPATTAEIRSKSRANLQRLFFDRGMTHGQRIQRVAKTLSGILAAAFGAAGGTGTAAAGRKRGKRAIGSVMELIDAAVTALLVRPLDSFATGEREAVVERIAEATLQYAIPKVEDVPENGEGEGGFKWVSELCPLHVPEACPLFTSLSGLVNARLAALAVAEDESAEKDDEAMAEAEEEVRERYAAAYRRGHLDPHILDTLHTGTMWPRTFLEDPDKECVQRSVGREVRLWTYAVLDAGVGLPTACEPEPEAEDEDEEDEEDEDELVDVVEEDEDEDEEVVGRTARDPLARLRGALKQLDGSDEEDANEEARPPLSAAATSTTGAHIRSKIITEYVRRGTRLAPEEILVPPLADLLQQVSLDTHNPRSPPQLWPEQARRTLLLRALASDIASVARLPDESLLGVLAVRWVVRRMDRRAKENPGVKAREVERWAEAEAKAVLASILGPDLRPGAAQAENGEDARESVEVAERHVQLVAQVLTALDAIEHLAQVLLLAPGLGSAGRKMSGARCHALLSGRRRLSAEEPAESVWAACVDGLEDAFGARAQKKKDKRAKAQAAVPKASPAKSGGARGGMFGLLADVDA